MRSTQSSHGSSYMRTMAFPLGRAQREATAAPRSRRTPAMPAFALEAVEPKGRASPAPTRAVTLAPPMKMSRTSRAGRVLRFMDAPGRAGAPSAKGEPLASGTFGADPKASTALGWGATKISKLRIVLVVAGVRAVEPAFRSASDRILGRAESIDVVFSRRWRRLDKSRRH